MSLSCFDDKRFVLDDVIHTLAYFHKDLRKQIHTNKKKCTQDNFRQMIIVQKILSQTIINKKKFSQIRIRA